MSESRYVGFQFFIDCKIDSQTSNFMSLFQAYVSGFKFVGGFLPHGRQNKISRKEIVDNNMSWIVLNRYSCLFVVL